MPDTATDSSQPDYRLIDAPQSARFLVSDLLVCLESYLEPQQIRDVYRAYLFGAEAHEGQKRLSGEPYIYHPVAVARILAGLRLDHKCLMAAILHDVIEDTETQKEQLEKLFDAEIAELVDGVSKLTHLKFSSHEEAQAANFRKMMLAMAKDVRVIIIKLADRLHNMRTLGVMRPEKSRRIARETLEIYAPIANRLGINTIRMELEELSFAAYWPMRFRILSQAVKTARGNRNELINKIEKAVNRRLTQEDLAGEVMGREKRLYSIYRKMRSKKLPFSEIADVYAFRIVVENVDACYRVLGVMHNLYKPVPGHFKDYIAIPKSNGYQSLHTVLFGPHGMPVEIQIRTRAMNTMAETGIAAHWLYKSDTVECQQPAAEWLQSLLEMQKNAGDSMEFLEHVKVDLFSDEVYLFTPKGRIMVLPKGSSLVDFAYAVHSDVGNHCVMARVDHHLLPLKTRPYSGQTVEIITSEQAQPHLSWLNFVVTGKARSAIRAHLKQLKRREAVILGERMLNRELESWGVTLQQLEKPLLQHLLDEYKLRAIDDLLVEIGLGNRMALLVARWLMADKEEGELPEVKERHKEPLLLKGTEGMVVRFAKCCRPIPGDGITGVFSRGSGLVVHRQGCPNLGDFHKNAENWIDVQWEKDLDAEFKTALRVDVGNRRGVLATVAAAISAQESNIENVFVEERDGVSSSIDFLVTVRDRQHLAKLIRAIKALPSVIRVQRNKG
ncbi:MAG: bifunctional GTP diphosphokinase/guanosine-3',5'-bis pyrophosphate 3'-pyrophosphohydrolase [gamma proteobacterium symbiont of Bathyaustriella thionipta]|nr:bifunctional GTP diphosphokinase/guanosine-3',5'-bis pyrophosphate 3'-pyrophosphohydrolase [gamma proteobacterium symbiont of Bathyaustriella thionipta]